jgi:crossover junction endodeoxyribonuclease RuvC
MKTILGIDPGSSGALSFYDGSELIIFDMPFFEIKKGKTVRKKIDFLELVKIIRNNKPDHAYLENVSAQFGNGAAAAFSFGWACACVENAILSSFVPFTLVTPQAWKKAMQVPADKDAARMRASQLLPNHTHNWDRKKDHNRAESALIAMYGYNK